MSAPVASIILNNYNYGRFLREAIDSALAQTYRPLEVIVVDDGSTDESRRIIASYGDRVRPVLKENGGQGSALNAGFAASRGEVVLFLDADDVLLPAALEEAVKRFAEPEVSKVHWPLWEIDGAGRRNGERIPWEPLPDGDFREQARREGPGGVSPPTSGNVWARRFLEQVMPMSEKVYGLIADNYLFGLAPAFGIVRRIDEPQSLYRVHGANLFWGRGFEGRQRSHARAGREQRRVLRRYLRSSGIGRDPETWKAGWFLDGVEISSSEIEALVPPGDVLILVDEDQWGPNVELHGRKRLPFLEREGRYWGRPATDDEAIREIERLREEHEARVLVLAWPAFWWLDFYRGFAAHLRSRYACLLENDRLVAFDLR